MSLFAILFCIVKYLIYHCLMEMTTKELHKAVLNRFPSQKSECEKIGIAPNTLSKFISSGKCGDLVKMKLNKYFEKHGGDNNTERQNG